MSWVHACAMQRHTRVCTAAVASVPLPWRSMSGVRPRLDSLGCLQCLPAAAQRAEHARAHLNVLRSCGICPDAVSLHQCCQISGSSLGCLADKPSERQRAEHARACLDVLCDCGVRSDALAPHQQGQVPLRQAGLPACAGLLIPSVQRRRGCTWMCSATVASVPMPWRSISAMRSRSDRRGGAWVSPCAVHAASDARQQGNHIRPGSQVEQLLTRSTVP